jgi:FKBP-type peptidyl-prolyl cis-trans isomerase 2
MTNPEGDRPMIEKGRRVTLSYILKVNNDIIDEATKEQPFEYTHGDGKIIPGLENRLIGLKEGDRKEITIGPDDAFGPIDPKAFVEVPKEKLPEAVEEGMQITAQGTDGETLKGTLREIKPDSAIIDFNHPLAGKELLFEIEVLKVA